MLESIFVGLIVVAATAYAVWALTPALSRNRFAARLAHGLGGPEASGAARSGGNLAATAVQGARGRLQRLPRQYADARRAGATEGAGEKAP